MVTQVTLLCKKDCKVENAALKKGNLYSAFYFERRGEWCMGIYIKPNKRVQLIFKTNGEYTLFFSEHFETVA